MIRDRWRAFSLLIFRQNWPSPVISATQRTCAVIFFFFAFIRWRHRSHCAQRHTGIKHATGCTWLRGHLSNSRDLVNDIRVISSFLLFMRAWEVRCLCNVFDYGCHLDYKLLGAGIFTGWNGNLIRSRMWNQLPSTFISRRILQYILRQ